MPDAFYLAASVRFVTHSPPALRREKVSHKHRVYQVLMKQPQKSSFGRRCHLICKGRRFHEIFGQRYICRALSSIKFSFRLHLSGITASANSAACFWCCSKAIPSAFRYHHHLSSAALVIALKLLNADDSDIIVVSLRRI